MKNLYKILVPLFLIFGLAFASFPDLAKAASYKEGTVTAHSLTVRSGPSASYKAVDWLSKGEKVTVHEQKGSFVKVTGAANGYVHESYLNVITKQSASAKTGTVNTNSLNVRSGPSVSHGKVGLVSKGDQVSVHESYGSWVRISGNVNGYVNGKYLNITTTSNTDTYKVERGDTLYSIAKKHGTSVSNLKSLNGLKSNIIVVGQNLKVTGASTSAKPSTPTPSNPVAFSTYKVQKGDTLYRIATKHNTTVSSIKSINGLKSDLIRVGQVLKMNGKAASTSPAVKPSTKELSGKVIVLDPGHGNRRAGAVSNGLIEKSLNLDVANRTKSLLESKGAKVIMTRTGDADCRPGVTNSLDLLCRAQLPKMVGADIFVSIHGNAAGSAAKGAETFYYYQRDKNLAYALQNAYVNETGLHYRRVAYGNFAVLRSNSVPSALIELGFLTNQGDSALLKSSAFRDKAANGIAEGIVNYFN